MEQQKLDFTHNTIQQINIYQEAGKTESKTDGHQVKVSPTQKEALANIRKERGIDASTFFREAMDFYLDHYKYRRKIEKHKTLLHQILESLP